MTNECEGGSIVETGHRCDAEAVRGKTEDLLYLAAERNILKSQFVFLIYSSYNQN